MKRRQFELPAINVTDLIGVLCKIRAERYPFERHIALRTFSAWVFWPTEPEVIYQAQIVSAAQVIRMIRTDQLQLKQPDKARCVAKIASEAMPPDSLSEILINAPLKSRFCTEAEEMFGVTDMYQVIQFFLSCPLELKPSLNKAIYFMERGGFPIGGSSATLRANWVRYIVSSPFIFVDFPAIDFQPDDVRHAAESTELLGNEDKLRRYFGMARFVQGEFLERLDVVTRKRFTFVDFPDGIDDCLVKLPRYQQNKIDIIKSYRAPR